MCRRYRVGGRDSGLHLAVAAGGPQLRQLFVRVDSVADYVRRAEQLGARTIIPPQTLPQGETLAIIQDVQGLPFGLISQAR